MLGLLNINIPDLDIRLLRNQPLFFGTILQRGSRLH